MLSLRTPECEVRTIVSAISSAMAPRAFLISSNWIGSTRRGGEFMVTPRLLGADSGFKAVFGDVDRARPFVLLGHSGRFEISGQTQRGILEGEACHVLR